MNNQNLTNIDQFIPTVVLSNTVLFPGVTLPLLISKETSISAIKQSMEGSGQKLIVAVTLKSEKSYEHATENDFYSVGTLCSIQKVEKNKNGETVIMIKGLYRISLLSVQFDKNQQAWTSQTEPLWDHLDLDKGTETALLKSLKDISTEIVSNIKGSNDLKKSIEQYENIAEFSNVVAQNLQIEAPQKQELLEMVSVKNRSLKVLELLVEQREMIKVSNEMGLKISEKTSKAYRESILREQLKAIREELGEDSDGTTSSDGTKKSLRERILEAKLPKEVEKVALEQASRFESYGSQNAEAQIIKTYIDLILALPWNDSEPKDIDLDAAQKILDEEHFGLEKIKKHIIQHLAVMKLAPHKKGSILLFVGPPGVGKTSLGQSIAKALGRTFVRATMGGVRDDAEIRGHRRTYVGALPGRIIEGIKRAKEKNPVFMLDEIDKLGRGYGGDPAMALLEVLDPEQNSTFLDHYLDLPYDLSKVFFIATANSLDTIPGPLLDRMEVIQLTGYTTEEKLHIAKNHLLLKQLKEHGLTLDKVTMSEPILKKIIEEYTREAGVRDLQRKIAKILRNISEKIVRNKEDNPVTVEASDVEEIFGNAKVPFDLAETNLTPGVVTGLAWTPMGGDILFIESLMMPGSGKIQLTGKLGEVMSESAHIGLSLVRSKLSTMLPGFDFTKTDFHIHVPAGAIPKDGPSAGITIFTALCSLVLNRSVDPKLAMTGELTLRGSVLPVGGIKEKVIAAHRAGIKKIILSRKNENDLKELTVTVRDAIEFQFVDTINELLLAVFGKMSANQFTAGLPPIAIPDELNDMM